MELLTSMISVLRHGSSAFGAVAPATSVGGGRLAACLLMPKRHSGHSRWAKIRHSKGAADVKKGQIFASISKEILAATKEGGTDMKFNLRLAAAIKQAKQADMPKENVERAIKRAASKEYSNAESVVYEGLGPHGIAFMIECLTDNKNRAVKALRNKFNRMEGSMTSVGYMFEMKGCIWFTAGETGDSEDIMFEKAIEAGAEDIAELGDGRFEVTCEFNKLRVVTQQLSESSGYTIERMAGAYISTTSVDVNEEQAQELLAIIDDLEELDDVVKVYSNMA
ncbi:transcriptional regulator TACO1-like protein [Kickxella alabastrina]|uniref:transcriptional regulator TACO1-like protein n=1 Tax=Kickxella alabastrina TaxID=61397 RepID=UPI00221F1224|nr:transcriptional regulator TACO1-like protein [Kickxella alabastrina]KAI7825808.1 transcriptional regulator TACO1-like protein [Kickxella alabastrina]